MNHGCILSIGSAFSCESLYLESITWWGMSVVRKHERVTQREKRAGGKREGKSFLYISEVQLEQIIFHSSAAWGLSWGV